MHSSSFEWESSQGPGFIQQQLFKALTWVKNAWHFCNVGNLHFQNCCSARCQMSANVVADKERRTSQASQRNTYVWHTGRAKEVVTWIEQNREQEVRPFLSTISRSKCSLGAFELHFLQLEAQSQFKSQRARPKAKHRGGSHLQLLGWVMGEGGASLGNLPLCPHDTVCKEDSHRFPP